MQARRPRPVSTLRLSFVPSDRATPFLPTSASRLRLRPRSPNGVDDAASEACARCFTRPANERDLDQNSTRDLPGHEEVHDFPHHLRQGVRRQKRHERKHQPTECPPTSFSVAHLSFFQGLRRRPLDVLHADAVDAVALHRRGETLVFKDVSEVSVACGAHDLCRNRRSGRRTVRWERGVGKRHARRR